MALCPHCHTEKPFAAPVCHSCNHATPFLLQSFFSLVFGLMQLGLFVVVGWLLVSCVAG